jgi:hypothetical protein
MFSKIIYNIHMQSQTSIIMQQTTIELRNTQTQVLLEFSQDTYVDMFHNTHVFSSSHSDTTQTCVEGS